MHSLIKEGSISIKHYRRLQRSRLPRLAGAALWTLLSLFVPLTTGTAQEVPDRAFENLGLPNWAGQDYAPVVSPNGRFLIFQSDRPGEYEDHNLWMTENRNYRDRLGEADWTVPIPLRLPLAAEPTDTMRVTGQGAFTFNSNSFEGMASFVFRSEEPVEVYFTSARGNGRDGYQGLNIYFARFRDSRWSEPMHLNVINSDFDDRMPFVTQDGKYMYFVSNRPGGFGGYDVWMSKRDLTTGQWARPVNGGAVWNTRYNEVAPTLSPDGGVIFFSSDRPGGLGHYDFYASRFNGFDWERVRNLGEPFNSPRDDEYLSLTQETGGTTLWAYFASDRRNRAGHGEFDLYRGTVPEWLRTRVEVLFTGQVLDARTRKPLGVDATIKILFERETIITTSRVFRGDPENTYFNNFSVKLGSGREYRVIFSAPGYEPQEIILDYRGNMQQDSVDRRKIYMQPVVRETDPEPEVYRTLAGRVVDADTNQPLSGSTVVLTVGEESQPVPLSSEDATFTIVVRQGAEFRLDARADGYATDSFSGREDQIQSEIILKLKRTGRPCPNPDNPACLDNVKFYFGHDSSEIRAEDQPIVDQVVAVLKKHPGLKIRLIGHTSQPGTDVYNLKLSEARARSIRDALVEKGIATERLSVEARGEREPETTETDDSAERLNRRVEIRRIGDE